MTSLWERTRRGVKERFPDIWDRLQRVKHFYILGPWGLLTGKKAAEGNSWARCREICADPNNRFILRVRGAGTIVDGCMVMHNGLRVRMGEFAYYNQFARIVLTRNRGVHEPQEERVFQEVLKNIPAKALMIELGAYWAFYSMWFMKEVPHARCFMIEPDAHNLLCGQANFRLNGMDGTFIKGKAGPGGISIDDFIEAQDIDAVHILHADIQGAEMDMLRSCERSIAGGKIWYFFISTHSQSLHADCRAFLIDRGMRIIASADFDFGTYASDGILVARSGGIDGLDRVDIALRRPTPSAPVEARDA